MNVIEQENKDADEVGIQHNVVIKGVLVTSSPAEGGDIVAVVL